MADGLKVWQGDSLLARQFKAKVILTGIKHKSHNPKTEDQVQCWVMPEEQAPHEAVKSGCDEAVCGSCKKRPALNAEGKSTGPCYVTTFRAPLSVYRADERGGYPETEPAAASAQLQGRHVRAGAWGDPAAAPFEMWTALFSQAKGHTAYTSQWQRADFDWRFGSIAMLSCDTPEEYAKARASGHRTFRTRLPTEPVLAGEIECPASAEAGHRTSCNRCGLCDGTKGADDKRANITIVRHGPSNIVKAYDDMRARL
jgi:hypothetical protein